MSEADFVRYWARLYSYRREHLYDDNIGKPLSSQRVFRLFEWKNGRPLSAAKRASVQQNFIERLPELAQLAERTDAASFLKIFNRGGAIWRIYWLHLWRPTRFPIYDQHVHRAMAWIIRGVAEEIPTRDPAKVYSYVHAYLPFVRRFRGIHRRRVDRALWAFGKRMKVFAGLRIGSCDEDSG